METLTDWRQLGLALHARFATGDFATGAGFVAAITEAAEAADHHPDVTLTYPRVELRLYSHDVRALTGRDTRLAQRISEIAAELGIPSEPSAVTYLELGLDTADESAVQPFWSAVLEGSADAERLWYQATEPHETPRQRFHLDLWVAPESLEARIATAVAAGGRVVATEQSFTVVADPDGNKVCFCVSTGR